MYCNDPRTRQSRAVNNPRLIAELSLEAYGDVFTGVAEGFLSFSHPGCLSKTRE